MEIDIAPETERLIEQHIKSGAFAVRHVLFNPHA
jgi:hypothetical protein